MTPYDGEALVVPLPFVEKNNTNPEVILNGTFNQVAVAQLKLHGN